MLTDSGRFLSVAEGSKRPEADIHEGLLSAIRGITVFALRSLDAANLATREEHLASEARLLADQLSTFQGTLRESTQRLSGLFEKRFSAGLSVHPDEPVAVTAKELEKLAADLRHEVDRFR